MNIGFLHPGNMGVSVAASAIANGHRTLWASEGRGAATRERADAHGLEDVGNITELAARSDIIFSICPPESAEDVARQVAGQSFGGIFVDGNAISPERMLRVASIARDGGASVVDGGIIGQPAWKPNSTWLHLSGERASAVAACFAEGLLEVSVLSDRVGEASALKMCYAALTKGTTALLCAVTAAADELGVRGALEQQWENDQPGRAEERRMAVRNVTQKAWRFVDELEEIARTFEGAGQPGGFHFAGAEIFARLRDLKDGPHPTELDLVLSRLKQIA